MNFSSFQKKIFSLFLGTAISAWAFANWRYEVSFVNITEMTAREEEIMRSTKKLINNCNEVENKADGHYNANHQICTQGEQEYERARMKNQILIDEKDNLRFYWWRNFLATVLCLNLIVFLYFRYHKLLISEQ